MDLVITLLYFLFILAAVVLIIVILLQEGKGGGFGQALGTSGQETFGAGARGINTFTAIVVGVFLASAMLITVLNRLHSGQSGVVDSGSDVVPPETGEANPGAPPAGPPSAPPSGPPSAPPTTPPNDGK
ncbi:MAG TPA: preprotein translocase subunit SecG [Planctomycetota bacterium]|nr:preprotein translocase subunit SecG [Planctomycetota bacterium]